MVSRDQEFDDWIRDECEVVDSSLLIAGIPFDPAEILKAVDPVGYIEKENEWSSARQELLAARMPALRSFKANAYRIDQLRSLVSKVLVVPFVGAGLSAQCGIATWSEFISGIIHHLHLPNDIALRHLNAGRIEQATEIAVTSMGRELFRERVRAHLGGAKGGRGAVQLLPELFDCPVVTTNLDHIIENVYAKAGSNIMNVFFRDDSSFEELLNDSERLLLKIHGDISRTNTWILSEEDYQREYGRRGRPTMSRALPAAISKAYVSRSLLFLGCSLNRDRVRDVFRVAKAHLIGSDVPMHFALMEKPTTDHEWDQQEIDLTGLSIFPIWYDRGDYDAIEAVLDSMTARV